MKTPIKTLLSREGDCSEKTITYSSLLEQAGIPHVLIYMEGHIAVGVEGNFSSRNGYSFTLPNGKTYHYAETTCEGFQIGRSVFREFNFSRDKIEHYQIPGIDAVYDMNGKKAIWEAIY
jgi:hypothetical protein